MRFNLTLNKILQLIVLVYQTIAVAIFMAALVFAYFWLQDPFLGAFFEPTMVRSPAGPMRSSEAWQLYNQGVAHGDQLLSVAAKEIHDARDVKQVLERFFPGETVPVIIQSVGGEQSTYDV